MLSTMLREYVKQAAESARLVARSRDPRHLVGLYRAYRALVVRPAVAPPSPVLLGLELTRHCTLDCRMCLRRRLPAESVGHMSFDSYRRVLDQFDSVLKLNLSGTGENLLNPEVFRMIRYAKSERRIPYVWMSSNAQRLDRHDAEELARSGLDWLILSIDSPEPETFARIRRGGTLERFVANVQLLVEAIRRERSHLRLTLGCIIQRDNVDQVEGLVPLGARLGVPDLILAPVNEDLPQNPSLELGRFELSAERRRSISALARATRVRVTWCEYRECFEPWTRPCVTWNGYLIPCYVRPMTDQLNFGNVLEVPFARLWNGPALQAFRRSPAKNPICRTCPLRWK
jgi:MoaA/NifB/PqqE/SkfB family radical SAM enzyme